MGAGKIVGPLALAGLCVGVKLFLGTEIGEDFVIQMCDATYNTYHMLNGAASLGVIAGGLGVEYGGLERLMNDGCGMRDDNEKAGKAIAAAATSITAGVAAYKMGCNDEAGKVLRTIPYDMNWDFYKAVLWSNVAAWGSALVNGIRSVVYLSKGSEKAEEK